MSSDFPVNPETFAKLVVTFVFSAILMTAQIPVSLAQTVTSYTNRVSYNAAIPASAVSTFEDFSSVATNFLMSTTAPGDAYDGFSAVRSGSTGFGTSGYCPQLNVVGAPTSCIDYNTNAPAVPGMVGAFSTSANVVFTPSNEAFAFAFDLIDWNDGSQRSSFVLELSNGTNIPITGPTAASNPPQAFFGYVLDSVSRDAGIHIDRITWTGLAATGELIGYWDIVTSAPRPEISVVGSGPSTASGQSGSIADASDTVSFTILVTNTALASTGPLTLTNTLTGAVVTCPSSGSNTINNLVLNASETCTVAYTLTQSDFDTNGGGDGDIDTTASASFNQSSGAIVLVDSDAVVIPNVANMVVVKSSDRSTPVDAGDLITYTYLVTNVGNVTISNISIDDVHNGSGPDVTPGGEVLATVGGIPVSVTTADATTNEIWDSLGPGDVIEFTGFYTATQNDIDTLQ